MFWVKKKQIDPYTITIDGHHVQVHVRKNPRAKQIILRPAKQYPNFDLVVPGFYSVRKALSFVEEKRDWMANRLQEMPVKVSLGAGSVIAINGQLCEIVHVGGRGVTRYTGTQLFVHGFEDHVSRRVQDWMRHYAKQMITDRAHEYARMLGVEFTKIFVADTRSKWGSCHEDGSLRFSWRLLLAPEGILDYVVAHEVAHLVEMNHSRKFWNLVGSLYPDYKIACKWLQTHGYTLYAYN